MGWDSESEQSSDEEGASTNTISYVLIAIDCDDLMFARNEENDESTFKIIIRSCYELLDNQLMKGGKRGLCPVAIALVSDDDDTFIISDFKDHLPSTVKKLRELCELSDADLEAKYKRKNTLQMSNFFLQCKSKLNVCGEENKKYISYITKDDNPTKSDDNDRRLSVNQAKSFKDFNIHFELLTFNPTFDYKIFFEEILEASNSKFSYEYFTDMLGLKDKLLSLMTYRGSQALFFPFSGRNNFFEIIEKGYIKPHKILNNVNVTRDTHAEVKEIKRGSEFKETYSLQYSQTENPFSLTEAERNALMFDDIKVGFTLLGTYEGDMIDIGMHCTDPKFMQRNKRKNCPHFDIFWQYCVDGNRKLICARKYKADGPTRIVQLTPMLINNVRSFIMLGIPYLEDVNYQHVHNPLHESKPIDNTAIMNAAEHLVKALDFPYNYLKINDTVNCRKWEYIRAELLEEKQRPVVDVVELNVVENDVTDIVKTFQELTALTGIKRKIGPKSRISKK